MNKIEIIFDYIDNIKVDYNFFKNGNKLKYEVNDNDNTNIEINYNNCLEYNFISDFYDDNACECYIDIYDTKDYLCNTNNYDYCIVRIEIDYRYSFEYVIKCSNKEKLIKLIKEMI